MEYFLWPFGMVIWYIFPSFGKLCQEKSGNSETHSPENWFPAFWSDHATRGLLALALVPRRQAAELAPRPVSRDLRPVLNHFSRPELWKVPNFHFGRYSFQVLIF
jgi:hypothetical protein